MKFLLSVVLVALCFFFSVTAARADRFAHFEKVEGKKALNWVRKQNKRTLAELETLPRFEQIHRETLAIYNDKEKLPYPTIRGGEVWNFWRDDRHVRGVIRKTSVEEYRKKNTKWEVLLDIDALAAKEKENWVFKGNSCLPTEKTRCLVRLSRGGKDAAVFREYDFVKKEFVKGGFYIPEAKSRVAWIDRDTLLVGTDWGKGSLNTSGYPRIRKLLKRGQKLSEAKTVFTSKKTHALLGAYKFFGQPGEPLLLSDYETFNRTRFYVHNFSTGKNIRVPVPIQSEIVEMLHGRFIFRLTKEWLYRGKKFAKGALVSVLYNEQHFVSDKMEVHQVFAPSETVVAGRSGATTGNGRLFIPLLDNVIPTFKEAVWKNGKWKLRDVELPRNTSIDIMSSDVDERYLYFSIKGYTQPNAIYEFDLRRDRQRKARQGKEHFNADDLLVEQKFAKSMDGTMVPYFLVRNEDTKLNGKTPTMLYGYGGFQSAETPFYAGSWGKAWLEKGGALVVANIRGGGEYGVRWHQAALKQNRQRAFDDFIAVAEQLIKDKVTSPRHLGIYGGSNGGLLVGAVTMQRPDLFNAVWCSVPLLDMLRFHKLLAGASWMGEYGNPDDRKMRPFLRKYSPFHNLQKSKRYPPIFFTTSTRDDRVHPAHARKMAAKMLEQGHPFYYYENIEGGHGAASNLKQRAHLNALGFSYFWMRLR